MTLFKKLFKKESKDEKHVGWEDITLRQFMTICEIVDGDLSDDDKTFELMKVVYGESVEDLLVPAYAKKVTDLKFLNDDMPLKGKPKSKYTINGKKYTFALDFSGITTAQYFDFTNASKETDEYKRYIKLLPIFLVPDGHKYGDGYSIEDVERDMEHISIVDAFKVVRFFFHLLKRLYNTSRAYLILETRKMDKAKAKEIQTLLHSMESSLTYLQQQNFAMKVFLE